MATKRKREDNSEVESPEGLRKLLLSSTITTNTSAKVALLPNIMDSEHKFIPSLFQQILTGLFILFGLSEAIWLYLFLRKKS